MTGEKRSFLKSTLGYLEAILLAVALALVIRTFVVQAFKIPSPSMEPTLLAGDFILVNKFLYGVQFPWSDERVLPLRKPRDGDVVVFRFPPDRRVDFVKRVVAVEGETLELRDKKLFVDGVEVPDGPARFTDTVLSADDKRDTFGPVKVPPGKVFVMGDNRDNSHDSRFWGFVDLKDLKGKAMVIYFSWDLSRPLIRKPWGDRGPLVAVPRLGRIGDLVR